jgi:hypothetical protein
MDQDTKDLITQGEKLFSQSSHLRSLWQDIGDHFYPERADFTLTRQIGVDFAAHLDTSYPLVARRSLGNAFSSMLRPSQKEWFHIRKKHDDDSDHEGREWLEKAESTQRRAMYDRQSGFVRATKEADHDFAAFGQACISIEVATTPDAGDILLHRCWHLRDLAWSEDGWGRIGAVYRKWTPTVRYLTQVFKGKVHPNVQSLLEKEPYKTINCMHIVVPSFEFDKLGTGKPYYSLYCDLDNMHCMEETGTFNRHYIIPRWQTVSGSQYAFSPATVAALPDARLLQSMTYTLLTAGEKAVDPPMIGVQDAIKGGIEAFAGGFTAVDAEYDERLGEALRALPVDYSSSMPIGMEMSREVRMQISEAFYLNSLNLPPPTADMTAFEVSKRIEEYIRNALPLFEPMESDYNGAMCEAEFDLMLRAGAFGQLGDMPESLRGEEFEFHFESPLREAVDRIDGQILLEAKQLIAEVAPLDPLAPRMLDAREALRDALQGLGTKESWLVSEDDMDKIVQTEQAKQQAAEAAQAAAAGAAVAQSLGDAGQSTAAAQQANQAQATPANFGG